MELPFNSLSEVLIHSANTKNEKGITFIESEQNESFLSYRELYDQAAYVLYNLRTSGLKPGDELVFQFQYNKNFIITFWACILGKIIPVPISFGISDEIMLKLTNVWKLLNDPFVITDFPDFKEMVDSSEVCVNCPDIISRIQTRTLYFDDVDIICKKAEPIPTILDDIVFIQYSSGSTGKPKGVINTHESIIYNIYYTSDFLKITGNEKLLSWMPLTHDMGLIFFHLLPLFNRAHQYLIPPILFLTFPSLWMTKISDYKVTITGSPNFGYKYYLDHFAEKTMVNRSLESIKFIINSAEPISFEVCNQFVQKLSKYKLNPKAIRPSYGLAEATLGVSSVPLTDEFSEHFVHRNYLNVGDIVQFVDSQHESAASFVDLGIFPFTSVLITDEAGKQLPENTVGVIRIKGPCVTRGYYNDPVMTNEMISKDGWLDTGDIGFIHNQRLVIVGRLKEIIIINGQNYYPLDLERLAADLEDIGQGKVAVTSFFNHQTHVEEVLCFVVFRLDKQDLKDFLDLAIKLKIYFIDKIGIEVHQIIPIDKIPVTTSGKIQRYKLKERYLHGEFDPVVREISSIEQQMKTVIGDLPEHEIREIVINICKEVLKLKEISIYDNFFDLGGNSSYALRVKVKLEIALGIKIDDTAIFKNPTIKALTDYLTSGDSKPGMETSTTPGERLEAFINERRTIQQKIIKNLTVKRSTDQGLNGWEIAVIGMSARFPGAKNIHEFWDNLKNGVESISFFANEELKEYGVDPQWYEQPNYVKAKGIPEEIEYFDAAFFGYTPVEIDYLDPQVRIFHECLWEALEDAGYDPTAHHTLVGVYAGASPNHFWDSRSILAGRVSGSEQITDITLNDKDFMTTRASYKLNLKGPSFTMYTACSTSLVAVDLACQGLLTGKCDLALTGGVSIWLPYKAGYFYEDEMIFSRDGHNRTFDARANGTVFNDGAGIVVLKRLEDALTDKHHIYAVIKGSAVNNDGNRKVGYTAPALEGQAEVIAAAQQVAGVEPESISYVEAHGTATTLGDPIEIDALKLAFNTPKKRYCAIGSVKSNVGHLNAAAGMAGLIKTVLALKQRLIPPSLHFETPNPRIDFGSSPFYVNTTLIEWKTNGYPLRAGVSSFGIGGTNAHVVLEEWPESKPQTTEDRPQKEKNREYQLILLSAKTQTALDSMTKNLAGYFKKNPGINLENAAYTLQVGRKHFQHRRMAICPDYEHAVAALSSTQPGKLFTGKTKAQARTVIFMFPGQGSQYVNMGLGLYRSEKVFRQEMNQCFEILRPLMGYDIKEILYPSPLTPHPSPDINQPEIAQPLVFIFGYALAKLLISWGITPEIMIGYSLGEYMAACLAGVFSLEAALTLVVTRANLIAQTPPGAMLSVPLPVDQLKSLPDNNDNLSIAIDNGPSTIVSGTLAAIEAFEKKMKNRHYICTRVENTRALHSKEMDPISGDFEQHVAQVTLAEPQIPFISNVTGKPVNGNDVTHPNYWVKHLKQTVQFAAGIKELVKKPNSVFIEIGPGRDLSALISRYVEDEPQQRIVNLVRHPQKDIPDTAHLLGRIGRLWLYGVKIDWEKFYSHEKRKRISLPTYPFERKRFPIDAKSFHRFGTPGLFQQEAILRKKVNLSDWFYVPSWKRSPLRPVDGNIIENSPHPCWLIFIDQNGLGSRLGDQLKKKKHEVITVNTGEAFSRVNPHTYIIEPGSANDYTTLMQELLTQSKIPHNIVHLWNITEHLPTHSLPSEEHVNRTLDLGFFSLVFLAQAISSQQISQDIRIDVVTNHMQEVVGGDGVCPEKTIILGPCQTIPREYPNIKCRSLDIVSPYPVNKNDNQQVETILRQLLTEITTTSPDETIAYRGNYRWVRTFEPYPLDSTPKKPPLLKQKGVYLITGGLGGIGLILAEHLAKTVRAKLVLTGRSAFPPREQWEQHLESRNQNNNLHSKIQKLLDLEKLGAEVLALSADITDQQQMQEVLTRAEAQFGRINGVIHAAGLADGIMIQLRTREESERILAPKVRGTMVLDGILQDKKPDFFILCSSIASILTHIGQSAYCSANAFLDAYAHYKSLVGDICTVSINWDRWENVGIATIIEKWYKDFTGEELTRGITPEEGVEAFTRIIGEPTPQVIVSIYDLEALIKQSNTSGGTSFPGPTEENTIPKVKNSRPELETEYVAPGNETEQIISDIWSAVLGYEKIGTHDDFFDLGGDSLKAIAIISKINKELSTNVPIPVFFNQLTINRISGYINHIKESSPDVSAALLYPQLEPVKKKEFYPTTVPQQKFYFLSKMPGFDISLNLFRIISIEGKLDKQRFREALQSLIKRQESLRTSFHIKDEQVVMKIHETVNLPLEYVEWQENKEESLQNIINRFSTPYDLTQAPLLKVKLVKLAEEKHLMLFDVHHIITDDTSMRIFMKELSLLYKNEKLLGLSIQYKDYAQWQKKFWESQLGQKQEKYWLERFAKQAPFLDMPTDYPRPKIRQFEGECIPFNLEKQVLKKLKRLGEENAATLYMILLTAVNILLNKYTGQEDITITSPIIAREQEGLENIIGLFINLLPIRNFPDPGKTVGDFMKEVKNNALAAYENQMYPFGRLVEKLDIQKDLSRDPLNDIELIIVNTDLSTLEIEEVSFTFQEYYQKLSLVDISIEVTELKESVSFKLMYSTKLFKRETMERFINSFKEILMIITENKNILLGDINLSSALTEAPPVFENDTGDFGF